MKSKFRKLWICCLLLTGVANATTADMLFSIQASSSQLMYHGGQRFELVIPLNQIHSILAFSDRPKRIAFKLVWNDFLKLIETGDQNVNKVPPNLVVSFGTASRQPIPFIAYKIHVTDDYLYIEMQSFVGLKKLLPFKDYNGQVFIHLDAGEKQFNESQFSTSLATEDTALFDSLPQDGSVTAFAFAVDSSSVAIGAV